jgi:hypothetical protein
MPKATAVWLIDNTTLTFEQIGEFCGLHPLEVQGVADGEVAIGIVGLDPTTNGQLTSEEIKRCEADVGASLTMAKTEVPRPRARAKGARYTPVSKRHDRPDAIAWMLRFHPEVADSQIIKLMGTTKNTINAVRDRSHWNISNIKPQDPVSLGICTQLELDEMVTVAQAKLRAKEDREAKKAARDARARAREEGLDPDADAEPVEDPAPAEEPRAPEPEVKILPPAPEPVAEPVSTDGGNGALDPNSVFRD